MGLPEDRWGSLGLAVDQLVSRTLRALCGLPDGPSGGVVPAPDGYTRRAAARDLDDDSVKLVGYSIVSLLPGHERQLKGGSQMVTTPTTGVAFALWMMTDFVNDPENRADLRPGEEKYLRFDYGVRCRWPRQDLRYKEKKLQALEAISRALDGCDGSDRDPSER